MITDTTALPTVPAVRVRRIADDDWDTIVELERDAYTPLGLTEGRAALQHKASVSPLTCCVLDTGSGVAGYALALPYPAFRYPELEETRREPVAPADPRRNLHLHDIVVARPLRCRGLAQHLLRHLVRIAQARGDERISLVAVGGSERFWSARGFVPHPGVVASGSGYGAGAVYMSRAVLPARAHRPIRGAGHSVARPCSVK